MKTKTRLTITLSQDILARVDGLIDGHSIRSRSHSIESLIRQSLNASVHSAVVLAGAKRTDGTIPALRKINKRYVLSIMIDQLKKFGITRLVICAGQNEAAIQKVFGSGSEYGIQILYSSEEQPLGSAGAIKNAEASIGQEPFLVINDSTLTNLNLDDLFEFHLNEGAIATICVKPRMSEEKYGQAFLHGNKIIKFLEKSDHEGISIVNVGLYVLQPEIFTLIEVDSYSNLETDIFPKLAEKKELSAFLFQGSWFDASKENSYKEAVKNWKE